MLHLEMQHLRVCCPQKRYILQEMSTRFQTPYVMLLVQNASYTTRGAKKSMISRSTVVVLAYSVDDLVA